MREKNIYICEICGKEFNDEKICFTHEIQHEKLNNISRDLINKLNTAYTQRMKNLVNSIDTECAHSEADDLLCSLLSVLGFKELVNIFEKVTKYYS